MDVRAAVAQAEGKLPEIETVQLDGPGEGETLDRTAVIARLRGATRYPRSLNLRQQR